MQKEENLSIEKQQQAFFIKIISKIMAEKIDIRQLLNDNIQECYEAKKVIKSLLEYEKKEDKEVVSEKNKNLIENVDVVYLIEKVTGVSSKNQNEKESLRFLSQTMLFNKIISMAKEIISEDVQDIVYYSTNGERSFNAYKKLFESSGFELIYNKTFELEEDIRLSGTESEMKEYCDKSNYNIISIDLNEDPQKSSKLKVIKNESKFAFINKDNLLIIGDTYGRSINSLQIYGQGKLKNREEQTKLQASYGVYGYTTIFNVDLRDMPLRTIEKIYKTYDLNSKWNSKNNFIYEPSYIDRELEGKNKETENRLEMFSDVVKFKLGLVENRSKSWLDFFDSLTQEEINEMYVRCDILPFSKFCEENLDSYIGESLRIKMENFGVEYEELLIYANDIIAKENVRGWNISQNKIEIMESSFTKSDYQKIGKLLEKNDYIIKYMDDDVANFFKDKLNFYSSKKQKTSKLN